jgi:hypothetical protein
MRFQFQNDNVIFMRSFSGFKKAVKKVIAEEDEFAFVYTDFYKFQFIINDDKSLYLEVFEGGEAVLVDQKINLEEAYNIILNRKSLTKLIDQPNLHSKKKQFLKNLANVGLVCWLFTIVLVFDYKKNGSAYLLNYMILLYNLGSALILPMTVSEIKKMTSKKDFFQLDNLKTIGIFMVIIGQILASATYVVREVIF